MDAPYQKKNEKFRLRSENFTKISPRDTSNHKLSFPPSVLFQNTLNRVYEAKMKSLIVLGNFYELFLSVLYPSICGHCVIIDYLRVRKEKVSSVGK
jgi:hypothetical protein